MYRCDMCERGVMIKKFVELPYFKLEVVTSEVDPHKLHLIEPNSAKNLSSYDPRKLPHISLQIEMLCLWAERT